MQELLKKYVKILNLNDWEISVIEESALESEGASKCVYDDYRAVIKIKNELSDIEKEKTLIHELLHIIHRDELDIAYEAIENEKLILFYSRMHERSIEKMAKIIYRLVNKS